MKRLLPILIMVIAIAGGMWMGTVINRTPGEAVPSLRTISEHAQALQPPKTIEAFELKDHHDHPFTLASLQNKWSLLFFGYTHCPDICPTTLQTLADMMKRLEKSQPALRQDTQVVFVTVDPTRDTTRQLATYVPYFNQSFVGVTGQQDQIDKLTRQLGIMHLQVKNKDSDSYLVDHSASVLLFGPDARLHGIFSAPHETERMLRDYQQLRKAT